MKWRRKIGPRLSELHNFVGIGTPKLARPKIKEPKGVMPLFSLIGWSLVSGSILAGSYPAFEFVFLKGRYRKKKLIQQLHKAFRDGELYKTHGDIEVYPQVLKVEPHSQRITFVFSIPKGMNPETFEKRLYVFKQHFSEYVSLNINDSRGILKVYPNGLPTKVNYNYERISDSLDGKLPVLCGQSLEGGIHTFDMTENPHVLISGETGSGKSSEIRSILATLIKRKSPKELQLLLGDLKRSEFHLFKRIEHVTGVYHSADTIRPELKKIKREMVKRGNKLDEQEVNSINDLNEKLPYIIVCIDEVVLLKKETDIMDILEEISSIGRSLGVFVILSMQRPDSKLLDGKLKVNLTVRMGFKTADSTNSKIIGTPGAENLAHPGRMMLKVNSSIQEIQCPWLGNDKAKKLLQPYKRSKKSAAVEQEPDEYAEVLELFKNE